MHLRVKKLDLEIFTHAPPQVKFFPQSLSSLPKQREITHSSEAPVFFWKSVSPSRGRGWAGDYILCKIHFLNLALLFIIPLDRLDQTSGYSTCYKENALLNLMGNSSEWKMNFKYPCYSFPFPYLPKTKNRYLTDFTKIAKFLIKSFKKRNRPEY